jgi:hypothetical protein
MFHVVVRTRGESRNKILYLKGKSHKKVGKLRVWGGSQGPN